MGFNKFSHGFIRSSCSGPGPAIDAGRANAAARGTAPAEADSKITNIINQNKMQNSVVAAGSEHAQVTNALTVDKIYHNAFTHTMHQLAGAAAAIATGTITAGVTAVAWGVLAATDPIAAVAMAPTAATVIAGGAYITYTGVDMIPGVNLPGGDPDPLLDWRDHH